MGRMIQKTRVGYFIKFDLDEKLSFADLEKHLATLLDADIEESVKNNLQRYVLDYEDVSAQDLFDDFKANVLYDNTKSNDSNLFYVPYQGLEQDFGNILLPANTSTYVYDEYNREWFIDADEFIESLKACREALKKYYAFWIEFLSAIGQIEIVSGVLTYSDESD
jgi:hypothetical protein